MLYPSTPKSLSILRFTQLVTESPECDSHKKPTLGDIKKISGWHVAYEGEDAIFMSEAFLDKRKVVGLRPFLKVPFVSKPPSNRVYCHFWTVEFDRPLVVEGHVEKLEEVFVTVNKSTYWQHTLICKLSYLMSPPSSVSVTFGDPCQIYTNLITITYLKNFNYKFFGVCSFLNSNFSSSLLLEWLLYHRLIGVSHFTLYQKENFEEVNEILKQFPSDLYQLKKINFPFPKENSDEIFNLLSSLARSDCLLRNMYSYRFTFLLSTNQFVSLKKHSTLHQFISTINPTVSSLNQTFSFIFSSFNIFLNFSYYNFLKTKKNILLVTQEFNLKIKTSQSDSVFLINTGHCKDLQNQNCLSPNFFFPFFVSPTVPQTLAEIFLYKLCEAKENSSNCKPKTHFLEQDLSMERYKRSFDKFIFQKNELK